MNRLYCIIAIFASVIAFGQVKLATAVEGKDFRVGEKLKVTFTLSIIGNDRIQETPLRIPDLSKFEIINSGSDQNSFIDKETNEVANQIVMQFLLAPKITGSVRIGSALVQVNGKIYKTEPIDLDVKESRSAERPSRKKNVYISLELQDRDLYENEATVAVVRAYSKNFNDLRNVGEIQFIPQKNVQVKPISLSRSEIEQGPDKKTVSQIMAMYQLFSEKPGDLELLPAKAEFYDGENTSTLQTNGISLKIKPLPAGSPKDYKNVVGNYKIDVATAGKPDRIEVNKPLNILVKVTGDGNFNTHLLPKLNFSKDYDFYRPRIKKTGKRTWIAHYVVIPKVPGDINFTTDNFSFFNPKTRHYTDLGSPALRLHIMSGQEVAEDKSTMENVNEFTNNILESVNTPITPTKKIKVDVRKKVMWTTIAGNYGLMAIFALLMLSLLWAYGRFFVSRNPERASLGTVAETEEHLRNSKLFDAAPYLDFMKNSSKSGDYNQFFSDLAQMKNEAEKFVAIKYNISVREYFAGNYGVLIAENFQKFLQQADMERFAPTHNYENLSELYIKAEGLFTKIK